MKVQLPLFDLDELGNLNGAQFVPDVAWTSLFTRTPSGITLTTVGRHHGLGPGILPAPYCGLARYDGIATSAGRKAWIWHACSLVGTHDLHRCDRCEVTW